MYHIIEAMTRWLAPILSFTSEELWGNIPGERGESVFLTTWYELPQTGNDELGADFWPQVLQVRQVVKKQLEELRVAGEIGGSLDAEVDLFCGSELKAQLEKLGDELRFVLITSAARVHGTTVVPEQSTHHTLESNDELWIAVAASAHEKCVRCWHHREDVASNAEHPELCGRCVDNVAGDGEARQFA